MGKSIAVPFFSGQGVEKKIITTTISANGRFAHKQGYSAA